MSKLSHLQNCHSIVSHGINMYQWYLPRDPNKTWAIFHHPKCSVNESVHVWVETWRKRDSASISLKGFPIWWLGGNGSELERTNNMIERHVVWTWLKHAACKKRAWKSCDRLEHVLSWIDTGEVSPNHHIFSVQAGRFFVFCFFFRMLCTSKEEFRCGPGPWVKLERKLSMVISRCKVFVGSAGALLDPVFPWQCSPKNCLRMVKTTVKTASPVYPMLDKHRPSWAISGRQWKMGMISNCLHSAGMYQVMVFPDEMTEEIDPGAANRRRLDDYTEYTMVHSAIFPKSSSSDM